MTDYMTPSLAEVTADELYAHPERFGARACIDCRLWVFDTEDGWADLTGQVYGPDDHRHEVGVELLECGDCGDPIPSGAERICSGNPGLLHDEACYDNCPDCLAVVAADHAEGGW